MIVRPSGKNRSFAKTTRQCGSAPGAVILSAALVAVHGTTGHRTEVAMFAAADFALRQAAEFRRIRGIAG